MKRLAIALVVLLSAASAQAQYQKGDVFLYPRIGINVANMSNNDLLYEDLSAGKTLKSKGKSGLTVGAEVEKFVANPLSLSLGLFYSNQGYRYDDFGSENIQTGEYENTEEMQCSIHQLNVPLMANLYVTERIALKCGLEGSFFLKAKNSFKSTFGHIEDGNKYIADRSEDVSEEADDWFKKMSLSIPIGASFEYKRVVLDARYHFGITKATKIADSNHRWFSITLGYQLEL